MLLGAAIWKICPCAPGRISKFAGTVSLPGHSMDSSSALNITRYVEGSPGWTTGGSNADIVNRNIAKLVDMIRAMQQCAGGMSDKGHELGEKLKQLKGRIPGGEMPPGGAGDDDEDEDFPFGPQPGQKEGPSKDGKEIPLTPEQAGWLLDGYKLGSDRRLPMAQDKEDEPRNRVRPTW